MARLLLPNDPMRRSIVLLFAVFAFASQAGQLPLTVNELSLMLRTGYSSNTLMKELTTRRFVDALDEEKEKTLMNAGASPELIAALKNGTYSLSADKTAAVLERMEGEVQRRAQQAQAARKSDAAYQSEVIRKRTAKSTELNSGGTAAISEFLKSDLVQIKNSESVPVDETALANKKLIAFYFSAEWCGPCRKFTPQLVAYYNRVAPEHPEFEVVFFSSDRSQFAMEKYMRDENMPWLAINFSKLGEKTSLKKDAGTGIPSLVLVDSDGKLISSSYQNGQHRGPQQVLADLDAIFAGKPAGRLVDSR
ncbi:MAG TPA: thioredoxin-like domain-containing protein [Chthoniobacterales bacterium]|nr:thioredoxin-like domain-containing protein [Chthoniobacterales bacterium]